MKIIVKFSSEITIKSRSVRSVFSKKLIKNIKIILKQYNQSIMIVRYWDYFEIQCKNNDYFKISEILINIPGIHHFLLVRDSIISSLEDIYAQVMLQNYERFIGKSFCVRVKRFGNHVYNSQEIESYLGYRLCRSIKDAYVNLIRPDNTIYLEIKNNNLFIVIKRYEGLKGLPIGTQKEFLSLISGGFDSAVASYMMIRRGCKVHYCFFSLFDDLNDAMAVYRIIHYLWYKFSSSHKIKVISINFSEIVKEISSKVRSDYIGIVLKRMMIRAAASVAQQWKIPALITGEVLGQVSSQTLDNLWLINDSKPRDCMIFRPLIAYDKEKIIKLARKIGTEIFSKTVPEYCGIISKKSTIKADKNYLELEESKCNFLIMDQIISQAIIVDVDLIPRFMRNEYHYIIDTKTQLSSGDIILDIRTKFEQSNNPIQLPSYVEIKKIPFYQLIDEFPKLDQNKLYLLYCDHGIMSRLQAIRLHQKGFKNIKIYRFKTQK